jgi:hypothetical protein
MIKNRRRARLSLLIALSGTLLQLGACQLTSEQWASVTASLQALTADMQTFAGDFARQVLQAVVL